MYIAGEFTFAGGVQANHVARWNGQAWSSLSGGLGTHPELPPTHWSWNQVLDMVEFQGDVYVCGIFGKAGQVASPGIARWDGASWMTVGEPMVGGENNPLMPIVSAMVVHDDGKGPALYAAGSFVGIGQMPASGFAKWDGTSWTAVGHDNWWHGQYKPLTLASFNDGTGRAIYAGGYHRLGQVPLTRWDGQTWSNLVPGLTVEEVNTLRPAVEYGRPVLYIGGYVAAPGQNVTSLARWIGCPCYANCDASSAAPVLTANDLQCFLNAYARGDSYANGDGSTGNPVLTAADFACFLNRFAGGCP